MTRFFSRFGSPSSPVDLGSAFQKGEATAFRRGSHTLKKSLLIKRSASFLGSVAYQHIMGKRRERGQDIKDLLVFEMLIDYKSIKSIPLIEQTAHVLYLLHIELI